MKYDSLKGLSLEEFRRLTGVKSSMFDHMVKILESANAEKKSLEDRSNKLCIEDQAFSCFEISA